MALQSRPPNYHKSPNSKNCGNCIHLAYPANGAGYCVEYALKVSQRSVCDSYSPNITRITRITRKEFRANVGGGIQSSDIKKGDYVFPETSNFPIITPKDVKDAVSSWGRYKGTETFDSFKEGLTRICKRKGQAFVKALPDSWKTFKERLDEVLP